MNPQEFDEYLDGQGITGHYDAWVKEGWHPLVMELIGKLKEAGWDGKLDQIKEKFGGLRFYIKAYVPALQDIIFEYEQKSYTICEDCGQPGKLVRSSWWRTLCPEHTTEKP